MPTQPYDFEQSVGYWLVQTSQSYLRLYNEILSPHGITFRQSQVIGWLMKDGDLTQSELAQRIGVEPPTLVGILDRMERDGWIARVSCPEDRRCKRIRVGDKVDNAWGTMVQCALAVRSRATDGFSPSEVEELTRLLEKVFRNLSLHSDQKSVVTS